MTSQNGKKTLFRVELNDFGGGDWAAGFLRPVEGFGDKDNLPWLLN